MGDCMGAAAASQASDLRLVFSDMDFTYLADDKSIPADNLRLLDRLMGRGIGFVPCSGRPWMALPQELLQSPAVHYAVTSNGAAVVDVRSGRTLQQKLIGPERTLALYDRVRDLETTFDCFADGEALAERARFSKVADYGIHPGVYRFISSTRVLLDQPTEDVIRAHPHIDKLTLFFKTPADRQAIIEAVEVDPSLAWTSSDDHNLEVMDAFASKGAGLTWLCAYLGLTCAQCAAFGDSDNDLSMIEAAGLGVAMANAKEKVKAHADRVAPCDNNEAGVARFLEGYLGL